MKINKVSDYSINQLDNASKLATNNIELEENINSSEAVFNNKIIPVSQTKNDFNSQKIKSELTYKLTNVANDINLVKQNNNFLKETSPSTTDYKVQVVIKNLLQISERLEKGTNKYSNKVVDNCNLLRNNVAKFIDNIKNQAVKISTKTLEIKNNNPELLITKTLEINQFNQQTKETISKIGNLTNDFLYSTHKNLQEIKIGATNLYKSAKDLSNGNAFAIFGVLNSFDKIQNTPNKISQSSSEYQSSLSQQVNELNSKSKTIADNLSVFSDAQVDSLKTSFLDLAKSDDILEAIYKFNYPNEYTEPIVKAYYQSLQNLTKSILFPDFNPKGKSIPKSLLVQNTNDLRQTIKLAQGGDETAKIKLQQTYGYDLDNAPRAGEMLLATNFVAGDLDKGQVTAKNFPGSSLNKPIDINPPEVKKLLFGEDLNGQVEFKSKTGQKVIARSLDEYKSIVSENRSKAGIPANNGEPVPVHVSFEGGGGFGKRHAAAVSEMYNLGIVPASVSGVSAGSINAAFIAAGLSPSKADEISKDPQIKKFLEVNLLPSSGLTTGREFYRYMDQKLREVTGITDRPVTFADLKIPLYIGATKLSDSQAPNDMTNLEDRIFVFSKETTPNTPVAMAMTASAAVPGSFEPVDFVDVATGRTIRLVDGGMINNLPIGYQKNDLPEIALKLQMPNTNNPNAKLNNATPKPFTTGNLTSFTTLGNTQIGVKLYLDSAQEARNFKQRNNPPTGVFVLNVPTWNLKNFVEQDNVVDYQYDNKIDPELDKQTYQLTDQFFQQIFGNLNDPTKSASNLKPFPKETSFSREFSLNGVDWTVERLADSDKVAFRSNNGQEHNITLGKDRLENWLADDASFDDLVYRLKDVLVDYQKYANPFGI